MNEELQPELVKAAKGEFEPTKLKTGEELPPAVRQAIDTQDTTVLQIANFEY